MIIIEAEHHGDPDVLVPREVPNLTAAPGEVLVDLAWSGVLSLDGLLRQGAAPAEFAVDFPWTPGQGGAGVVAAVGPGVDESWVGRRVVVDAPGSYAQQVVVDPDLLVPVPDGVPLDQAIGLLHDGGTALGLWQTVAASGPIGTVAITPAAGGAGTILVQLAVESGCRVIGLTGGDRKVEFVRSLGAEVVIDHARPDWPDLLRAEHPDVLLDGIGGAEAATRAAAIVPGGTYLNYGNAGGGFAEFPTPEGVHVIDGSILGRLYADGRRARQDEVLHRATSGRLRAHIGATFPLTEAAAAHRALADRAVLGKALLDCGATSG